MWPSTVTGVLPSSLRLASPLLSSLSLAGSCAQRAPGNRPHSTTPSMLWRPVPTPTRFLLLILPLLSMGVAVWLWLRLAASVASEGYGPFTFLYGLAFALSLVLVCLLAYVVWCALSLQYRLDKENLTLRYAG